MTTQEYKQSQPKSPILSDIYCHGGDFSMSQDVKVQEVDILYIQIYIKSPGTAWVSWRSVYLGVKVRGAPSTGWKNTKISPKTEVSAKSWGKHLALVHQPVTNFVCLLFCVEQVVYSSCLLWLKATLWEKWEWTKTIEMWDNQIMSRNSKSL